MTDIHSHILPCVDDGSDSIETSRRILAQYVAQGVDRVICTPHQDKIVRRADVLRREFKKFSAAVADVPVRLVLGAEILYYSGMVRDVAEGELLTLGGSQYVLVEFPFSQSGSYVQDAVYELKVAGYTPIIAHIERYFNLSSDDYRAIKDCGALIQINAGWLKDSRAFKAVKYLLKKGLVDFVASDCHNDKNRNVDFEPVKAYVAKKFRSQYSKLFGADE